MTISIRHGENVAIEMPPIHYWREEEEIRIAIINSDGERILCNATLKAKTIKTEEDFCTKCGICPRPNIEGPCQDLLDFLLVIEMEEIFFQMMSARSLLA
jgi:hypothetical protein